MMKKTKVAVALSGGVDSGVAAGLLVKKGYQCEGFHLRLWKEGNKTQSSIPKESHEVGNVKCQNQNLKLKTDESQEAARKTAHQLGIPFYVLDFQEVFKKKVVDYFLAEYAAGNTPNPCVICNKLIKFGELLDYVRGLGFDYLATGHYCRIENEIKSGKLKIENSLEIGKMKIGNYHLLQAKDGSKDQSYFLHNLTQSQLTHVLFPVGNLTKKEVRQLAKKWQLPVAHRPESQEICFFNESDYRPFLKRQIKGKIIPGEVVDVKSNVIGRHQGLPLYTIGQRHGFEINSKSEVRNSKPKLIPPFYVIDKDIGRNQLIVGFGKETEKREFWVKNVSMINPNIPIFKYSNIFVKIRHLGQFLRAKVEKSHGSKVKVILNEPERGIAPGQAAVFYRKLEIGKHEVLGGGTIINS